jgi:class 3 adenylate cyclase
MTHLEYEWENPRWRRQVEGMGSRFNYIRYDGRGMGLSDRDVSDFSAEATVGDLEAVVDALGLEKVALLGLSQGGSVAIRYAVQHPARVSRLIIYGSGALRPVSSAEEDKLMLAFIRQGWDSDVPAHRQFFTGLFIPDADMEAIDAFNEMQRLSTSGDNIVKMFTAPPPSLALPDLLPRVAVPTLVIHRRGDAIVPFELGRELAAGIPGARFLPLDGRNHATLAEVDVPVLETMANAIAEFIGSPPLSAAAPHVPSGLVTILFTDMEGSTAQTQRLGDAKAQEVLRAHNAIIRDALKAHGGSETKHTGDGIMASFGSATKALECAVAIQRGFAERNVDSETPVNVRIGLNAGEPVAEDGDLFGATVQLAARVCNRAEPGQVLVSNVVRELAMGKGFLFADIGDFLPKGFEDLVRLYEVRLGE